jgi:purine-nucleoside phosphorylase
MDDFVLIEPRTIPGDPHIDHPVILTLFEPYLDIVRDELNIGQSTIRNLVLPTMSYYTTASDSGRISVFGTPLGCPQAAIMLERIIAMGAKDIIVLGCCGSLKRDVQVGSLVIPIEALSEEGTSVHYPLPAGTEPRADERISGLCVELSKKEQLQAIKGKVWTTDALFRETKSKVQCYADRGILAVEMEMSALFTISAYRQVRLGGCMVVSDELATLKWKTGFSAPVFREASRKGARLAIDVCRSLHTTAYHDRHH